ncbi:MAG: squalene/phytoene synthase family protein [Candidatus Kapabacteria bacterium]|nr:squalene/phytoene synthase family protein [Candidatus Kapabacteria bacterium]MDW8224600.1 squalene/phytoene synthase family protein [Bacteroidota bacterium]
MGLLSFYGAGGTEAHELPPGFSSVVPQQSNFYYSFLLLPRPQRMALQTIYRFASSVDSLVDTSPHDTEERLFSKHQWLSWWRQQVEQIYSGSPFHPALFPLAHVIRSFQLPKQYFLLLLDGCERDLIQRRYRTFDELKDYCYCVAGSIGLICIEIFGYKHPQARQYAIYLGYALQLTNILRDVKFDKDRGYIYLPQEDMERFGYTEADLMAERYDERFVELMRFEAQRARGLYHTARMYLHPDDRATLFAAEAMDLIYFRLLEKMELGDFRVFQRRYRVSLPHKLWIALKTWLSSYLLIRRLRNLL